MEQVHTQPISNSDPSNVTEPYDFRLASDAFKLSAWVYEFEKGNLASSQCAYFVEVSYHIQTHNSCTGVIAKVR